jgi:RNA polymerase sigma-70 factor (ECF subfamily)
MSSDYALPSDLSEEAPGLSAEQEDFACSAMIRYAAGDDQAFADVYAAVAPRLYRFCVYLAGHAEAGDLLQEVFLKMHRARGSFVRGGSVRAWSFAIARTTCIDRARSRRSRPEDSARPSALELASVGADGSPEDASVGLALEQHIARILLTLPESLRSAYVLVKIEGLTSGEAGEVLGASATATKDRVHRASVALRQGLSAAGWQ